MIISGTIATGELSPSIRTTTCNSSGQVVNVAVNGMQGEKGEPGPPGPKGKLTTTLKLFSIKLSGYFASH